MAFIRNMIVLGAVVALMPTDKAQQSRFYEQAASVATWTVTFCDRNVALCAEGQDLWGTFVKKAEFGASVAYSLIQQQINPGSHPAGAATPAATEHGTLRADDMRPKWRAPAPPSRPGA